MVESKMRLMCVVAHPDDESLAMGGILAHYSERDVEISLVCATRGERGWPWPAEAYPGPEGLGRLRERELLSAAEVLGIQEVHFLDYLDGEVDSAQPDEIIGKLVMHMRRFRPHVVVTFDPTGAYGHPDHIAVSQFATAAISAAANPLYFAGPWPPFQADKLYYLVWTQAVWDLYESVFGKLEMEIDGEARQSQSWAPWAVTTCVDSENQWQRVLAAILCHKSQLPNRDLLLGLDEMSHRRLWGMQRFYRAMSLVNGGRAMEQDLFQGVRCSLPRTFVRQSKPESMRGQATAAKLSMPA